MITCKLKGGLANIMFQIAAMRSLAKDNNTDVYFPNFSDLLDVINRETFHNPKINYASDYFYIFKNLNIRQGNPFKKNIEVPFLYKKIIYEDSVNYDGFFQSEKYFIHNRDFILSIFEPTDGIKNYIEKKYSDLLKLETCAIHVRRGDMLKLQHVHVVQGIEYFKEGIKSIGKVDKYVVFSDDIDWCKNNFIGVDYIFIENEKDYVDLFFMSMCSHQIISNSTFSWWAAWLNKNVNKKVVAPIKWHNNNYDSKDIVPDNWLKF